MSAFEYYLILGTLVVAFNIVLVSVLLYIDKKRKHQKNPN